MDREGSCVVVSLYNSSLLADRHPSHVVVRDPEVLDVVYQVQGDEPLGDEFLGSCDGGHHATDHATVAGDFQAIFSRHSPLTG